MVDFSLGLAISWLLAWPGRHLRGFQQRFASYLPDYYLSVARRSWLSGSNGFLHWISRQHAVYFCVNAHGLLILACGSEEIGLGRALEIDERARRSTDSRGRESN
jgi:hypothetical protein